MFCLLKRKTSKSNYESKKQEEEEEYYITNKKTKNKKSIKNKLDSYSLICHKAFHFSLYLLFSCFFLFNLKLSNKLVFDLFISFYFINFS